MKKQIKSFWTAVLLLLVALPSQATIDGSPDPASVVEKWSNSSAYPKVIDINFSDATWPNTWKGETGKDCPELADGGYVNTIQYVPTSGNSSITYPVLFHNCTFANKKSYNGYAGVTAAFARQYYVGEKPSGDGTEYVNNWTRPGHTIYLEDNIKYDATTGQPIYGEAGFVQMCRNASLTDETTGQKVSQHGWVEIDHIPYVERVQWSWSSTSWGRGIKCDVKIGDGAWTPLVWMGTGNNQKQYKEGYTSFSDQGYFMENVIDAHDVSIRWRIWDGDNITTKVQLNEDGKPVFNTFVNKNAEQQAARLHKIQIFGSEITAEQAQYAKDNHVSDVGTLSDLDDGGNSDDKVAPDAEAPVVIATVAQDGSADYTKIQDAINAVPEGSRGIIYIRPGVYDENLYAGTKGGVQKFISLIGEDKATTILTSSVDRGSNHPNNQFYECAALNVYSSRFYAENLTIRNTSGNVGQAEALYTNGDAHIFNNCVLSGWQDTYKSNVGSRGYFTNCTIEGATDFIYDGGLEWFDNCELRCLSPGSLITAPAGSGMPMTKVMFPSLSQNKFYPGLFFRNCNITAADGVATGSCYLGRNWNEQCGSMFIQCNLGGYIAPAGWVKMADNEDNTSLYEYQSKNADGTLADVSGRVAFSHQATAQEVEAYINPDFLFGKASDVPFDYAAILRGAVAPMNFVITPTEISWESDDNAAGYIIKKDGQFYQFTTEPSLKNDASDQSKYTVATVSRQGVVSTFVTPSEATRIKAFPTAEGFGKYATGGRGGKVVTVTSLEDNMKAGTLRWAFEQYPNEPITIVFAVSGEIVLTSPLSVKRADWTLAGQTAPGDGIVITHNKVNLGFSQNFIVRNIRFRVGQKDTSGEVLMDQALGAENCSNYIFDHCVFGWSVEENVNTADSHFLTIQNSIVHEGLYNAGHSKGARGYGTQWGGSPATYCYNLLANNNSRSPRFNGARGEDYVVFMEYINNVNYNFGGTGGCYGGENTAAINSYNGMNSAHECNFIGNYYKAGAASSNDLSKIVFVNSSYARDGATSWGPAKWYVAGNKIVGNDASTADNWKAMTAEKYSLDQIKATERIVPEHAYYKYSAVGNIGEYDPNKYMIYDYLTADEAYENVIAHAGTVNRDKIEQRIISDLRNGTSTYGGAAKGAKSGIIDTENDAEGFIAYSTDYVVPADTDGDGMPDEWEKKHNLDPNVADQNKVNKDGYTALEVYLGSLMGEQMADDEFVTGIDAPATSAEEMMWYDKSQKLLHVGEQAKGGIVKVFTMDGRQLAVRQVTDKAISLAGMPANMLLISLEGNHMQPRVLKVVK